MRQVAGLAALLLLGAVAAVPSRAVGKGRFGAGTVERALEGGYSINHPQTGAEAANGVHAIPHLGFFLADERGREWARGSFELLVEPTLIHLDASESTTARGVAILGRWVFSGRRGVRPYLEGGVGVLGGQINLRQTSCDTNFILQAGTGLLIPLSRAVAVTLGYRFVR